MPKARLIMHRARNRGVTGVKAGGGKTWYMTGLHKHGRVEDVRRTRAPACYYGAGSAYQDGRRLSSRTEGGDDAKNPADWLPNSLPSQRARYEKQPLKVLKFTR